MVTKKKPVKSVKPKVVKKQHTQTRKKKKIDPMLKVD